MIIRLLVILVFVFLQLPAHAQRFEHSLSVSDDFEKSYICNRYNAEMLKSSSLYKSLIIQSDKDYKAYSDYHKVITSWIKRFVPKFDEDVHDFLMVHNKDYFYHFSKYKKLATIAYKSELKQFDYEYNYIVKPRNGTSYEMKFKALPYVWLGTFLYY